MPKRRCSDCGADITRKRKTAVRCNPCARIHANKLRRERERSYRKGEPRPKVERLCKDCGIDISDRGWSSTRCMTCAHEKDMARKRKAYVLKDRRCALCDADISHRGPAAIWCEPCAKGQVKKAKERHDAKALKADHPWHIPEWEEEEYGGKKAPPRERPCLRCERSFLSESAGNRYCLQCRSVLTGRASSGEDYAVTGA